MNNHRLTLIAITLIALTFYAPRPASAQGPLTPPGPPGPTMLTLNQVEPRTPITNLPYIISASGSYYVTTNLTCTACTNGSNGITINTNDVTLDLSGFTLLGVGGSGAGIAAPNPQRNLAIRDGVLEGWAGNGVFATYIYNSQFERLRVSNTRGDGLQVGSNCVVLVCTVSGTGGNGIDAGNNSIVSSCTASSNSGLGIDALNYCTVIQCSSCLNSGDGIDVGNYCAIKDCNLSGNIRSGMYITGGQNRIDNNSAYNNSGYGFTWAFANVTNSITRNSASGNSLGNYYNFAGNNDYAPTGSVHTATNPWTNFQ
jgi:hypothetical protein